MAATAEDESSGDRASDAGDPWQWGFETSRLMGERLLELYSEVGTAALNRCARDGADDVRQIRVDMERWVDLSVELFDRAFKIMRRLGEENGSGDGGGGSSSPGTSLAGLRGGRCMGELWIHNVSETERTTPLLRCAGLTSVEGGHIPAAMVRFDIDAGPLDGRSSRRVWVVVDIPPSATPGVYHGQILSDASPDTALALRVSVRDA